MHVFPAEDVRLDLLPEEAITRHEDGLVEIAWIAADEWLEEDEELLGHAHDPFHRIDALRTSRHIRVSLERRAAGRHAKRGRPVRDPPPHPLVHPARRRDRRAHAQRRAPHHVRLQGPRDSLGRRGERAIAWSYELPLNDAMPVRSMIAFYNERVDIEVDGGPQARPHTQWSALIKRPPARKS